MWAGEDARVEQEGRRAELVFEEDTTTSSSKPRQVGMETAGMSIADGIRGVRAGYRRAFTVLYFLVQISPTMLSNYFSIEYIC